MRNIQGVKLKPVSWRRHGIDSGRGRLGQQYGRCPGRPRRDNAHASSARGDVHLTGELVYIAGTTFSRSTFIPARQQGALIRKHELVDRTAVIAGVGPREALSVMERTCLRLSFGSESRNKNARLESGHTTPEQIRVRQTAGSQTLDVTLPPAIMMPHTVSPTSGFSTIG